MIEIGSSIGRYHILERLGEGGMATVYKALDTRLERQVAIKVIRTGAFPPDVLDRILKRFDREAKSLARLNHPNIVGIIDYGEQDGTPYLVMPYYPSGTLKGYLGKPTPPAEAARLLAPVARALAYAHQQGILHRDVKPSNILITGSGEPVLTDFGIAKLLEDDGGATLTGTGVGVGTPEYMAPEQGMGREIDGRADVYALGVVLYELVTGRKPYTADTPMAVIFKHLTDPLPRPKETVPDLPEWIEQIIFKAMAKKPEDRYQSMDDFAAALATIDARSPKIAAEVAEPQPSSPRPESDLYDTYNAETGEATLDIGETPRTSVKTADNIQDMPAVPIPQPTLDTTSIPPQQGSQDFSEVIVDETGEETLDLSTKSQNHQQNCKPEGSLVIEVGLTNGMDIKTSSITEDPLKEEKANELNQRNVNHEASSLLEAKTDKENETAVVTIYPEKPHPSDKQKHHLPGYLILLICTLPTLLLIYFVVSSIQAPITSSIVSTSTQESTSIRPTSIQSTRIPSTAIPRPTPTNNLGTLVEEETIEVSSKVMWVSTKINVSTGDRIVIEYISGTWSVNPQNFGMTDGDGYPGYSPIDCCEFCTAPMMNGQLGQLVAKIIGSKTVFPIGNQGDFSAEVDGTLCLMINDLYESFGDDEGSITVRVSVYRP